MPLPTILPRTAVLAIVLAVLGVPVTPAAGSPALTREPSADDIERRIDEAARRLEVVVEKYNEAREDLRDAGKRSRDLGRRLGPMTVEMHQRQERIGGLIAETYQRTRSGPTIALLGSGTPHQFVDRLLVLNQLATEQHRAVVDLRAARTRVDGARRSLTALAARQHRQQARLEKRKAVIEGEIAVLKDMRRIAYGDESRSADETPEHDADRPAPPYVAGPAGAAVAFAFRQLGKPYRWGASGPQSYDCSGLTSSAWARAGVGLPHNARRQFGSTSRLDGADLRPGDLIFYYGGISHVGIYVGDGRMIHAPVFGENVRIDRVDFQPVHGFGRPR